MGQWEAWVTSILQTSKAVSLQQRGFWSSRATHIRCSVGHCCRVNLGAIQPIVVTEPPPRCQLLFLAGGGMSEWLLLPDSVGPWPCFGSPPPESMTACRGFCIDISSVGFWPPPWSLRKQQIKPQLFDGETEPLTWALLRACSSRRSDLSSHFHSHELGNLLALSLWNTIDLRHLNRDKPYFSFILISGLFQSIEGLSHPGKPEKPSRK